MSSTGATACARPLVGAGGNQEAWLARFHEGERALLEQCYREHYRTVESAVQHVLRGADMETVVHDVFLKLLSDPRTRQGFRGGSFGAWISRVARNKAIDHARRHRREQAVDPEVSDRLAGGWSDALEAKVEARRLIERFRQEKLPHKWQRVFVARFIEQLSQREAAAKLGVMRTTLAYQELRIRKLLRSYLLEDEP